jgi:hypothetical protein
MFGETFPIIDNETTDRQMDAYQGIAAQALRAAGIETGEDDRRPLDILSAFVDVVHPEIVGVAKERMIYVKGNLPDPGMPTA